MSCEHLICAQCAGPVAEGRCPVCRASKAHLHHDAHILSVPHMVAILLLVAALVLAMQHLVH